MPLRVSICVDPPGTGAMVAVGWTEFTVAAHNNPELCQRSMDSPGEQVINPGQAVTDIGADCLYDVCLPVDHACEG